MSAPAAAAAAASSSSPPSYSTRYSKLTPQEKAARALPGEEVPPPGLVAALAQLDPSEQSMLSLGKLEKPPFEVFDLTEISKVTLEWNNLAQYMATHPLSLTFIHALCIILLHVYESQDCASASAAHSRALWGKYYSAQVAVFKLVCNWLHARCGDQLFDIDADVLVDVKLVVKVSHFLRKRKAPETKELATLKSLARLEVILNPPSHTFSETDDSEDESSSSESEAEEPPAAPSSPSESKSERKEPSAAAAASSAQSGEKRKRSKKDGDDHPSSNKKSKA